MKPLPPDKMRAQSYQLNSDAELFASATDHLRKAARDLSLLTEPTRASNIARTNAETAFLWLDSGDPA